MHKKLLSTILCLFVAGCLWSTLVWAQEESFEFDAVYTESVFADYSLSKAVQMVTAKELPLQKIIAQAQKSGHRDQEITSALYASGLDQEEVIMACMLSHMRPRNVLRALDQLGVGPEAVLELLVAQEADLNRIVTTGQFMLDQGYNKADLVAALSRVGASQNTINSLSNRLGIPPAAMVDAFIEMNAEPGSFGHVFTRNTLPNPALDNVGINRVNDSDQDVISPMQP